MYLLSWNNFSSGYLKVKVDKCIMVEIFFNCDMVGVGILFFEVNWEERENDELNEYKWKWWMML